MSKIIFVTGGARSGKSAFAQEMAGKYKEVAYIATAPITDTEMEGRVRLHQQSRPQNWKTVEAQKDLPAVFKNSGHTVFLVDCLTVYIANAVVCRPDIRPRRRYEPHSPSLAGNYSQAPGLLNTFLGVTTISIFTSCRSGMIVSVI